MNLGLRASSEGNAPVTDENAYTLVVGLGSSGFAAARRFSAEGDSVLVIDSRLEPPALGPLREQCPRVRVELGTLSPDWLAGAERVVLSPGLSVDTPLVLEAERRGIPVVGEIELFAKIATAPVIAVTGSNGKSTVTSLTAEILVAQGFDAPRGGNLGPPALELLEAATPDAYVLEISSFQMETTRSLEPLVAAVLNVSADHIDRHGSIERYAALKERLLHAARRGVFNLDDPIVSAMGARHSDAIPFSVQQTLASGWSVLIDDSGTRWLAHDGDRLLPSAELSLGGRLGEANSLAALALCDCMHGEPAIALDVVRRFPGLPHRCRLIAERRGVRFVDDSKGTNVGATVAALEGTDGPVVLIAGGMAKGADFAPLVAKAHGRVRAAVFIGQAAADLERVFHGEIPTSRASSMAEAVAEAARQARPGDTVLLSPACASQDMFVDYRDRGDSFARAVAELS